MTAVHLGMPSIPVRPPGGRPDTPALVDSYGRVATDLRISVTDRCNLRCTYCMPEEGLNWLPTPDVLDTGELSRLIRIAVLELGVTELRFTGGEPLLRKDLETVLAEAAALSPRPSISLTTNGLSLARRAERLLAAGVDRVNVSLDTLRPDRYLALTRRDRLADVLAGLRAARAAGLDPVKVNSVLMRGVNEDEAVPLLAFCLAEGLELRFIEQMPLDPQHGWDRGQMVGGEEILAALGSAFTLTPDTAERGAAPAERWLVDGGPGRVGVIASVSAPFCGACDRTRLTADGQVRSCLFGQQETDLRGAMRAGAGDEELAELWRAAMWAKPAGHGINEVGFAQPSRPMSAIGG
ncbi:cyclic pyranopterin phosphate synthase [Crossiella equi]|uniref:GTP 3',8-cyclase n=2 Tax=Crossiella equi TaxID=130796 RepID=A0ABS5AH82_9PSEU|nr:cyclic pyranopterin phosphate synthase [Crossiella equi]